MSTLPASIAFARPCPYFLVQGVAQTLTAPLRSGSAGSLVAPTEAGSSVTIRKPGGTALVSAAAVTVSSSIASYAAAADLFDDETIGAGFDVEWTLVVNGSTIPFRQPAYLCEWAPVNMISVIDLYDRVPELQHRIPQAQGTNGDGTGWTRQIDSAFYELLQRLLDDGRKPWLIREITGMREWLLTRALQLCVEAIEKPSEFTERKGKELHFAMLRAEGRLRFQFSDEPTGTSIRRGQGSVRLGPVGRRPW